MALRADEATRLENEIKVFTERIAREEEQVRLAQAAIAKAESEKLAASDDETRFSELEETIARQTRELARLTLLIQKLDGDRDNLRAPLERAQAVAHLKRAEKIKVSLDLRIKELRAGVRENDSRVEPIEKLRASLDDELRQAGELWPDDEDMPTLADEPELDATDCERLTSFFAKGSRRPQERARKASAENAQARQGRVRYLAADPSRAGQMKGYRLTPDEEAFVLAEHSRLRSEFFTANPGAAERRIDEAVEEAMGHAPSGRAAILERSLVPELLDQARQELARREAQEARGRERTRALA